MGLRRDVSTQSRGAPGRVQHGDVYDRVYAAQRPGSFFNRRLARGGASAAHSHPRDSAWNVPEPE
jgi:hypothetical protein